MGHQRARLVETVVEHLTNADFHEQGTRMALALPAFCPGGLRGAMAPLGPRSFGDHHRRHGGWADGFSGRHTGHHQSPRTFRAGVGVVFASLRSAATPIRKFAYAESLFGDDLAAIDPTIWEQSWLFFKQIRRVRIPTGPNAGSYPS